MKTWWQLVLSFFAFCLILFGFIMLFAPDADNQGPGEQPVGQLPADHTIRVPGSGDQPAADTQSDIQDDPQNNGPATVNELAQ